MRGGRGRTFRTDLRPVSAEGRVAVLTELLAGYGARRRTVSRPAMLRCGRRSTSSEADHQAEFDIDTDDVGDARVVHVKSHD
ncbi:hypothetical protein GCM10009864_37950 [Streptomyces lunalinharesii]|uniref:Uncharacterized protein n=1 Tax=Streptomyces lunalinharesii TaxID=333384 RepID=A0ABN3S1U0_9ACTN